MSVGIEFALCKPAIDIRLHVTNKTGAAAYVFGTGALAAPLAQRVNRKPEIQGGSLFSEANRVLDEKIALG